MTEKIKDENTTGKKVGVYICHCGGNISDHVDVEKLADNVRDIDGVAVAHTNMFMCSDPGQELIREDIQSGKIDRVVVASCAPSLHETTFHCAIQRAGMNPYLYDHANIREQVSWVHHGDAATAKATRLVAASIAKAKQTAPLEPIRVNAATHATIIGGGVAGMRAALDLSKRGIRVTLLEKSAFLGGRTARLDRLMPGTDAAESVVRTLGEEALSNADIEIHGCSEVIGFEGYVGNFKLTVQESASDSRNDTSAWVPHAGLHVGGSGSKRQWQLETGAVILATGFSPYRPREGEYGYLQLPGVVTLPDFIRQTAESDSSDGMLTVEGRPIRRVAMIHCVGSRQIPGIHEPPPGGRLNEYCSRTCCGALLQSTVDVRQRFPKTQVFDYYRDIRTYGRGQEEYYEKASDLNVLFFRYEPDAPPLVERTTRSRFPLSVRVADTLTFGEEVSAEVDLVVLGVGMEATPISDLVTMMKLPTGMDGFLQEVHPKLRPVEIANNGILLAGTCQAPMDVGEACSAAQASAAKAAVLLDKGFVELDPYVARVNTERCTGQGRCAEVCPVEGAVTITGGKAGINPALCTGCGICVGECPEEAIDVAGWTLAQYEDMVDAITAG